uniref:Odorant receptor n=1 Tax=Mythimna separata TaxID=271217 RepID=A0A7H1DH89_MYTSE|nr:olfactory receptor 19 [Mythimna separata]
MDPSMKIMKPNEMTKLMDTINTIGFLCGLKDIWITDVKFSKRFINIYNKVDYIIDILNVLFTLSVLGSLFTQKDLTEKQANDRLIYSIVFPGQMILYFLTLFHKQETRNVLYHLVVVLKERQNDAALEREMIKKIKLLFISFFWLITFINVAYGFHALYQVVIAGETFITVTSVWPDVRDTSTAAGVMRVFFYLWWFPLSIRVMYAYVVMITTMVAICYQFKNLQIYFYQLDDIFEDRTLSQEEKEVKYEQAFKLGIQMHSLTLWCKKQHQHISKEIFAVEIVLFFSMLLTQLKTLMGGEHNLTQLLTLFMMTMGSCMALGFFMWNGGDVTVEAAKLAEAMYSSGWENCYGQSSVRIRKLVVNAMRQAQEPVVYKTFGVVEFSYETYVTLVRMPYTAVSVFY